METNARIANVSWSLQGNGNCGISAVAMSALFSSPGGLFAPGGKYLLAVENDESTAPIHVQAKTIWTDRASTVRNTPITHVIVSNEKTFGGSTFEARSLLLVVSGGSISLPLDNIGGSGLQVVVYAASSVASATLITGYAALWRL